jgi:hypothetical protein
MLTLLRIVNVALLLSIVACIAGALAGLIVLVPFLAGAWFLNATALVGFEEHARPGWARRVHAPAPPVEAAADASREASKRAA